MRSSIVLALAASAAATSFISVVNVGNEIEEAIHSIRRGQDYNHRRGDLNRDQRRGGRYEDRYGRGSGRDQRGHRNGRDERHYDILTAMGSSETMDVECQVIAVNPMFQREALKECCNELKGKLHPTHFECDFVNAGPAIFEQWLTCTEQKRGVIDGPCRMGQSHNGFEAQRRHRYMDVLVQENEDNNAQAKECHIDIESSGLKRYKTVRCCLDQRVRGELLDNGEMCIVDRPDAGQQFTKCVMEEGFPKDLVQCQRLEN